MDEWLKSAHAWAQTWQGLTLVIGAAFGVFLGLLRYRERAWSFSARKQKRLRKLFKDYKWRKAAAFDRDNALLDAVGNSVTGAELAFIETRDRPMKLLAARLRAGDGVKWRDQTGDGWADNRHSSMRWFSPRATSTVCLMIALAVFIIGGGLTVLSGLQSGLFAGIMVAVNSFIVFISFLLASISLEASHQVIHLDRFPQALPIPPRKTTKSGKSKKLKKDKETPASDVPPGPVPEAS